MIRILTLVSNNVVDVEIGESFLDRRSISFRTARSLDEARRIVSVWSPSLIVVEQDFVEPSLEACLDTIRLVNLSSELKFLVLSNRSFEPKICDAQLNLPVTSDALLANMAELIGVRQRRGGRVQLETLLKAVKFNGMESETYMANGINISETGILVELESHIQPGSEGRVLFFLPGHPEKITAPCVLKSVRDPYLSHYALEFVQLAPEHGEIL